MTPEEERYMACEGLVQWTQAVVAESHRLSAANNRMSDTLRTGTSAEVRQVILAFHSECHFFAVAAYKVLEFRDWASDCGLYASVDFSEIDSFSAGDIRALRNMREHIVEYFRGKGNAPGRWVVETPESMTDASSVCGTNIGGRLDWVQFGSAAERLLSQLLAQPIPYPQSMPPLP